MFLTISRLWISHRQLLSIAGMLVCNLGLSFSKAICLNHLKCIKMKKCLQQRTLGAYICSSFILKATPRLASLRVGAISFIIHTIHLRSCWLNNRWMNDWILFSQDWASDSPGSSCIPLGLSLTPQAKSEPPGRS